MQTQTHHLSVDGDEVSKCFVSWDDGEADREWACLNVVWEHAPGIAPRPLRRESRDGRPVVVMQRIAGDPLGDGPLTVEQNDALGRTLAAVYAIPVEHATAAGLTERRGGPSALPGNVLDWLREEHDLTSCHDPRQVEDGIEAAVAWLARSEAVPEPRLSVLGIADLNPANVLWDGTVCRLVDFEDGGTTDPAFELADHVEHLAGRLAGVYDAERLPAAVGLTSADRDRMRAYRPLWASFWLAMLLPGNGGFHRNPPGTTEAQARHLLALLGR